MRTVTYSINHWTPEDTGAGDCFEIIENETRHTVNKWRKRPEVGFHMEPKAFLAGINSGATATWHTHPGKDPNLSEEDMAGFRQWPQLRHYIVGIRDGQPYVQCFAIENGILLKVPE